MEANVFWIPIVAIAGSFLMVVAIVWFGTRAKERTARYRADVQMKMLDRFGSAAEFTQFLESPTGKEFLQQPQRRTRDRALGNLTGALITSFIGLAFLASGLVMRDDGFFIPAFILLAIGIALFISSAIAWKLNKQGNGTQPPAVP
jgi:hypothetical protein